MRDVFFILILFCVSACSKQTTQASHATQLEKEKNSFVIPKWIPYDEQAEIKANANHSNDRMKYKLIQSRNLDRNEILKPIRGQLGNFSHTDYQRLHPLIFEKDILEIQTSISQGQLSYEKLVQWYLYRIVKYESNKETCIHSLIALNPKAVEQARAKDEAKGSRRHPIFGMPILLKDNINTTRMPTTAGAAILKDNRPEDAFIVKQLKSKGAIILGKANLSEWAYYFCNGCPLGYSAIGGQTLNPYGRKKFETGGSSAGSGTTIAANYAVAAIGTETSGSILSPSSQNSLVGLKPTVGLLSRTGIVPISAELDTPGPMTRSVTDNAILLSALTGMDDSDAYSVEADPSLADWSSIMNYKDPIRLAVNNAFMEDSLYAAVVKQLKEIPQFVLTQFDPTDFDFSQFRLFLNADMKKSLPQYLKLYAPQLGISSVSDVVNFNRKDTVNRSPYGQGIFEGIVDNKTTAPEFSELNDEMKSKARDYLNSILEETESDAILSINNYNAGHAAFARYPCITLPMGYREDGEPANVTLVGQSFEEYKLLQFAHRLEKILQRRKAPKLFP